jgi:hypothetical protein
MLFQLSYDGMYCSGPHPALQRKLWAFGPELQVKIAVLIMESQRVDQCHLPTAFQSYLRTPSMYGDLR